MKPLLQLVLLTTLLSLVSCAIPESRPEQAPKPGYSQARVQKSQTYGDKQIILQRRKRGIETNDLILKSPDGALRFLSDNRYFIQDFCISRKGILYYAEAGFDAGRELLVGSRSGGFSIRSINLKDSNYPIKPLFPAKNSTQNIARPNKLELDHSERYLCFATDFGDVHVIDLRSGNPVDILPKQYKTEDIHGKHLTKDRRSFLVHINTGPKPDGSFNWQPHLINLSTKKLTPAR